MTHVGFEPASGHEPEPSPPQGAARAAVLVALHGTRARLSAIQVARLVADAVGATLHGLFVWPLSIAASEVPRLLELGPEELAGMVIDVAVGDPVERLGAAMRGVRLGPPGGPGGHAEAPMLTVIPADIEGPDPFGAGTLAARVLTEAPGSVLLVRPGPPLRLRRILVPLDGVPSTASAIRPAAELARATGAALDIVFVGEGSASHEPGCMHVPRYVDQPQHEWDAFAGEFVERFLGALAHCHREVPMRLFLGRGDPAVEILRFADSLGADLLALAWHGALADAHGAVFRQVLRGARVPVLVMRS